MCVFMYIILFTIKILYSTNKLFSFSGFTVTYSQNRDVLAGLRESVVLKFYRVKPLQTEDLKVEWRRKDSKTLVHLYPDGESRSEKQQQEYQNRAHFFTDQIQHGNFSLRLDNVEEEDAGEYICRVYSKQKCVQCNSSHEYNCEML
uniref:Ig-like domain-containing protein n=1 Tax=Sinocyclocheilus anshuiensis TaxID=1608454 RepID=A0A671S5Q4_9TELE